MVPPHSGHNSGKWFTKVSNDNCSSFVSHFVWEADVSGTFHLYHARAPGTTRVPYRWTGTVKGHFTTQLVPSRLIRSFWDHRAGPRMRKGEWMQHHNHPEAHHWRCMKKSLWEWWKTKGKQVFQFYPKNKRKRMLTWIWIFPKVGILYILEEFLLV